MAIAACIPGKRESFCRFVNAVKILSHPHLNVQCGENDVGSGMQIRVYRPLT